MTGTAPGRAPGADPTRVLLVDDHPIVRRGMRSLLSGFEAFEVVAEAESPEEAIAAFEEVRPDVCMVDIRLGAGSGLDVVDAVLDRDPDARVLVVSSFDDAEYVTRSLRAGALGYVLKVESPAVLVTALESVSAGRRFVSPQVTGHLVDHLLGDPRAGGSGTAVSDLERRMLGLLSKGWSNQRIADELYMSDTTVKRRLRGVFAKLGVTRRAEAVGEAARRGLLDPGPAGR